VVGPYLVRGAWFPSHLVLEETGHIQNFWTVTSDQRYPRYKTPTTPRPIFVNKNMSLEHKDAMIKLLKDYVDCFAYNYRENPGLSQELVEHWLSIKSGFSPYKL
jgi:RAB protein geranylgeranyltransferase component A